MKTAYKMTILAVALVAALFATPTVNAANLNDIQLNKALGHPVTRTLLTDGSVAIRIRGLVAGSTLTVTSGDFIFTTDGTTADASLSDGTSAAGTLDTNIATANTWGELCDLIDADANWEAELVDVLPSWSCDAMAVDITETDTGTGLVSSTVPADGAGLFSDSGIQILYDTSSSDKISASISPTYTDSDLLTVAHLRNRNSFADDGRRWRSELYKAILNGTTTNAPNASIYLVKKTTTGLYNGATEQLLWRTVGVADETDYTLDFTDLPPVSVPAGAYIVVVYDGAASPDFTTARITVHGMTWQDSQ